MALVKNILCPTDFSGPSAKALDYAVALATEFHAALVLLHVVEPTAYPLHNMASISGFPNLRDEITKRVESEFAARRQEIGSRVALSCTMREGIAHDQILEAASANGCDLIVMATRGHTGLKHVLLGSTAERVVRLSPVPVLTLRVAE